MQIIGNQGDFVAGWVAERLSMRFVPPYEAVGIYSDDGKLLAGAVYHMKREAGIEMAMAADSPCWASRWVFHELLAYPFRLGCRRITALARMDNARSRRLLEGVGFIQEGVMRQAARDGGDYIFYGLTKSDFEGSKYGQGRTRSA